MSDAELIAILRDKALAIMHEAEPDTDKRADRLEVSARYLICCAILANEIGWKDLERLTDLFPA
jgi:hypothetical protein